MAPPRNTQYISSMTIGDLRGLIQEEMNKIIKSQIDERRTRMEDSIKVMSDYGKTLATVEAACNHTSQRLDALHDTTLPNLASHIQKVADALVFQTLDLDVHRRKWNLTLHGLPGEAGENEDVTRQSCIKLAREKLGITEAKEADFSDCHRLKQGPNAGIIIRFRDLGDRNMWLDNAGLKDSQMKISLSPDLPPKLRQLKTELLNIRKGLPTEQKSRSTVRYLAQWPYVKLSVAGRTDRIRPTIPKETIVTGGNLTGSFILCPFCPSQKYDFFLVYFRLVFWSLTVRLESC